MTERTLQHIKILQSCIQDFVSCSRYTFQLIIDVRNTFRCTAVWSALPGITHYFLSLIKWFCKPDPVWKKIYVQLLTSWEQTVYSQDRTFVQRYSNIVPNTHSRNFERIPRFVEWYRFLYAHISFKGTLITPACPWDLHKKSKKVPESSQKIWTFSSN